MRFLEFCKLKTNYNLNVIELLNILNVNESNRIASILHISHANYNILTLYAIKISFHYENLRMMYSIIHIAK